LLDQQNNDDCQAMGIYEVITLPVQLSSKMMKADGIYRVHHSKHVKRSSAL
jgi:hypothetical protein